MQSPPSGSPPQGAATSQQSGPPPQTPPPAPLTPAQVIAAILSALSAAITAAQLVRLLAKIMKAAGIGLLALRAVAVLMMSWPQPSLEGTGPAQRQMIRTNTLRRAQFMYAACKRVQAAIVAARSQNQAVTGALRVALAAEQRWMGRHIAASTNRMQAATTVDALAHAHGNLLGWNAVKDSRCSPGCRAASGKNFRADKPPVIEGTPSYPGAVHPACRCFPSAPHRGAPTMP